MTIRHGLLVYLLLGGWTLRADVAPDPVVRGTRVEWARLRADAPYWDRHAAFDSVFLEFMGAHTSLNIDPEAHWVRADAVDQLCAFPFIFAANIEALDPRGRANLAEYLRRGGFILMDLCLEPSITPNTKESVLDEIRLLLPEFPNLHVTGLRPSHPVFSSYFQLQGKSNQLAAIYDGKRVIGMLSLSGLQCDLANFHRIHTPVGAAQLLTNIYVYALTGDRAEPASSRP